MTRQWPILLSGGSILLFRTASSLHVEILASFQACRSASERSSRQGTEIACRICMCTLLASKKPMEISTCYKSWARKLLECKRFAVCDSM